MITNNYYVYVFLRTDKKGYFKYNELLFEYEPFYVGKGINDRIVSSMKCQTSNNYLKHNIINKIHRNNMEIKSLKISENLSEEEAFVIEKYYIDTIGKVIDKSGPLSNLTDGGIGYSNVPVLQYNIKGHFMKEYKSVGEAIANSDIKNISACCRGIRKTAGGYIWKYKEESIPSKIGVSFLDGMIHSGNKKRSVIQYDMNNNFLKEYASVKEASIESECSSSRIVSVCKGDRKHTKNFKWKYKKDNHYE